MKAIRLLLALGAIAIVFPVLGAAQSGELYAGYSYLRVAADGEFGANVPKGANIGATVFINHTFGIGVDYSFHAKTLFSDGSTRQEQFLFFQPTFSIGRNPRFVPSLHIDLGFLRDLKCAPSCSGKDVFGDQLGPINILSYGLGGAADVRVSPAAFIRVIKLDYIYVANGSAVEKDLRLGVGVGYRF